MNKAVLSYLLMLLEQSEAVDVQTHRKAKKQLRKLYYGENTPQQNNNRL